MSTRCRKPVSVLIMQCPFCLHVDLYSCSCIWFLPGFSWPRAAAQSQINKDLCCHLLQNLLACFRAFIFPCARDVGCSTPGFLLVIAFLGRLRESPVFAFLCKLIAARTVFCLLLSCGCWRTEKEMSPVVLYHAGELCLALFLNMT